ncbi:MAG: DUF6318 family protein [Mycobacteriales bacterium]
MSIFGPDIKLIPPNRQQKWRQGWWWREKRPAIIAVLILALVAGLAVWLPFYLQDRGEDSNPRPRGSDTSQTPTVTPSGPARPAEQAPVLPEAAKEFSAAGIEATIRFEIDAINYAQRTGDLEPLKSVYDMTSCEACKSIVEGYSDLLRDGVRVLNGEYTVTAVEDARASIGSDAARRGDATLSYVQQKEARLLDKSGAETSRRPPQSYANVLYSLSFSRGQWIITKELSGEQQ